MNPQQLIERLDMCVAALGRGNTQLKTLGLEKAKTERDYKVRQAQEILKLRIDKQPVTIIQDLVKGNEEVAELRLKRDIAQIVIMMVQISIILFSYLMMSTSLFY